MVAATSTAAKSPQSYPIVCDPMDCSLPGSSVHGVFQARVPEWVAIAFSAQIGWAGIKWAEIVLAALLEFIYGA